jgi:hypothetical protein
MTTDYAVQLTMQSTNRKTGPIPVSTTTKTTCWDGCAFYNNGCYFDSGPGSIMWRGLSEATPGTSYELPRGTAYAHTWDSFCGEIDALPADTFWRHDQAGNLPGTGARIDGAALRKLVAANRGKRGFTYTHKPMAAGRGVPMDVAVANIEAVADANRRGFTINLSGNHLAHADILADLQIGPVVVALPHTVQGKQDIRTPAGRRVVVCPATYREDVSCDTCRLCQVQSREVIVGFPAHGSGKARVTAIAEGKPRNPRVQFTRNAT